MKKTLTLIMASTISISAQANDIFDKSYSYIDVGYNKIFEDKEEETGTFNTFDLIDSAQGYNIGIGQKINDYIYFDINYASYEDKGTQPVGYIGPTINESEKLHAFTTIDFKIGYIYDLTNKNYNVHINPYLTFGTHNSKDSQITYVDSERNTNVWSYGLELKHAPYGNDFFYYSLGFQKQDTVNEELISDSVDEVYYGNSERYKIEANYSPLKKLSFYINYEFVYSGEQYNEVLTGGYYLNADNLNIGLKFHY